MALNGCCDLELDRAHWSTRTPLSTLLCCSGTNDRFLSLSKNLVLRPHRTTHWLKPTSKHAFSNNPQVTLVFLRVGAEAGSIQDIREIGFLPHLLNKVLDVQLTGLKLVGTQLHLFGVPLSEDVLAIPLRSWKLQLSAWTFRNIFLGWGFCVAECLGVCDAADSIEITLFTIKLGTLRRPTTHILC